MRTFHVFEYIFPHLCYGKLTITYSQMFVRKMASDCPSHLGLVGLGTEFYYSDYRLGVTSWKFLRGRAGFNPTVNFIDMKFALQ